MVVVHHLNSSRSQKVIWLLEELGVNYQVKLYKRLPTFLAPPELRKVHPLGKSPVLEDNGRFIAETSLITEYLVEEYGPQMAPPKNDKDAYLRYRYWVHFEEATAMPWLVTYLVLKVIGSQSPWFLKPIARLLTNGAASALVGPYIETYTQYINDELAKNPKGWLIDEFSAADLAVSFHLEFQDVLIGLAQYPQLSAYVEKMKARPAYKRAMENSGENDLGIFKAFV